MSPPAGEAAVPRVLRREDAEAAERQHLMPYACLSSRSLGRRHREEPDPLRTLYQRDRDRIIHSTAFRRLLGKTQVFISETGDHFRVRLTHSLEVAQIARSISRSLGLNEDLTEGLALAHDLGHAPFGHSGGDALAELMVDHGGFEHNRQGLRVVDRLETIDPAFPGLNLSYEFRESILKHKRPFGEEFPKEFHPEFWPCLEAQVVDWSDGIAYNSHDLDDGLAARILTYRELEGVALWERALAAARELHPGVAGRMLEKKAVAQVISLLVRDLVEETGRRLDQHGVAKLQDVRTRHLDLVGFSPKFQTMDQEIRSVLYKRLYMHYRVARMRYRARIVIRGLFEAYRDNRQLMPERYLKLAQDEGLPRAISDYIAGMTDSYAQRQFRLLFAAGPERLD